MCFSVRSNIHFCHILLFSFKESLILTIMKYCNTNLFNQDIPFATLHIKNDLAQRTLDFIA